MHRAVDAVSAPSCVCCVLRKSECRRLGREGGRAREWESGRDPGEQEHERGGGVGGVMLCAEEERE